MAKSDGLIFLGIIGLCYMFEGRQMLNNSEKNSQDKEALYKANGKPIVKQAVTTEMFNDEALKTTIAVDTSKYVHQCDTLTLKR